jgi:MtN3 and saliva related transmembrane protein
MNNKPSCFVKWIDRAMAGAAVIHPLTALPQVIQIYTTQSAAGVSLLTWLMFMALGSIFLAYGIVHRIKPFIVTQILWFIVDFLVVIGVLLYGG